MDVIGYISFYSNFNKHLLTTFSLICTAYPVEINIDMQMMKSYPQRTRQCYFCRLTEIILIKNRKFWSLMNAFRSAVITLSRCYTLDNLNLFNSGLINSFP